METGKIYNESCLDTMAAMSSSFIDLVLTSPPYDNLRSYTEDGFDFDSIANELYRVTKPGGILVWIVGDATINGSETLSSFKQAIYFRDIGFNVHDTMIYQKNSYPFPMNNRYYQVFEYMFIFSKGAPKTCHIQTQRTVWKKRTGEISTTRQKNGNTKRMLYEMGKSTRKMDNVWRINTGYMRTTKDRDAYKHPAIFPEALAERHILSWSNENDLVYDPFMGSGTTAKMALLNNRRFIGSEISDEYCKIAEKRIQTVPSMGAAYD